MKSNPYLVGWSDSLTKVYLFIYLMYIIENKGYKNYAMSALRK